MIYKKKFLLQRYIILSKCIFTNKGVKPPIETYSIFVTFKNSSKMIKINTCEIVNQVDNKCLTLYVEWLNSHFKIILLEPTMPPLSGEMVAEDIDYFCKELDKSSDEYLQETKNIFCGKDEEIQFYIQDDILRWERKKTWTLGKITLCSVLDIKVFSEAFQQLLKLYQSIQDKIGTLERENKSLRDTNADLLSKINKMVESKATMEQDLYKKFILILNSKKKRIRELEAAIKEKQNTAESVFDADTDEGEESEDDDQKPDDNRIKIKKRKSLNNDNPESIQKARKKNSIVNKNHIDNNETINKTTVNKVCTMYEAHSINYSTASKNENIPEEPGCSFTTKSSRSSLNFVEEESEDELFS